MKMTNQTKEIVRVVCRHFYQKNFSVVNIQPRYTGTPIVPKAKQDAVLP